ncbi:TonB family protein [Xanthomonas sp. CFBP 8703]|uniref:TonB family protein n=1 Tax=Xanthomonas bonasiae TaxID=2810351 RepID=A0ABS3B4W6_9XANT|nr:MULTISPECIES: energy transducer TonB [Xanthomonas]MBD7924126.1 TonB family protein [Xanthomonas surreyensis]MBN6101949.1 TonB family protein [Xanthomonas bonasiae]
MRQSIVSILIALGACVSIPAWADTPAAVCQVDAASQRVWPAPFPQHATSAGVVTLDVTVGKDGRASYTRIRTSSGQALLDASARRAVQHWTFRCPDQARPIAPVAIRYAAPACSLDIASKNRNPPTYPAAAKAARQQGDAYVSLRPQSTGADSEVRLVASSGSASLDQAALAAARKWRFACATPASANGWIEVPVRFELDTPAARAPLARAQAPGRDTQEADAVPLPYRSVAEAANALPKDRSLKTTTLAATPAGMHLYQSTKQAVEASEDYAVVNWIVFLPPHPLAPSVVRYTTSTDFSGAGSATAPARRVRAGRLCEASAATCQRLDAQIKKLLGGDR